MIQANSIADVKGKWINDDVKVLETPQFDRLLGKWTALAIAYGTLAIIELRVTREE
jgi:hypothetical protein